MTDTGTTAQHAVAIPADVKDNSPHTVLVGWRNARPEPLTEHDLTLARDTFGYTVYQWDDVNKSGDRVTLTRMDKGDRQQWLYETSYFTRVKCADCEHSYAQVYQQITVGDMLSEAVPRCDTHAGFFRRGLCDMPDVTLYESETLRIGQH